MTELVYPRELLEAMTQKLDAFAAELQPYSERNYNAKRDSMLTKRMQAEWL